MLCFYLCVRQVPDKEIDYLWANYSFSTRGHHHQRDKVNHYSNDQLTIFCPFLLQLKLRHRAQIPSHPIGARRQFQNREAKSVTSRADNTMEFFVLIFLTFRRNAISTGRTIMTEKFFPPSSVFELAHQLLVA